MATQRKTLWPQVAYGLGGAFNALRRHMNASFSLIFYMNVIGLTSGQAGIIRAAGSIISLVSTLLFGYLCDNVDVPYLSRRLGRRKTWHLLTSVFMALFVVMGYMRCYLCGSSVARLVAYYLTAHCAAASLYAACEITHLSIIPAIAQTVDEAVVLNYMRQGFTYITGILTYAVAWAILGQSSGKELSPSDWKYFTIIAATLAAAGLVCVAMFQTGTHEPRVKKPRKHSTALGTAGLLSVSVVFGLEAPEEEEQQDSKPEERKTSVFRKFSNYLMPFDDVGNEKWEDNRRWSTSERKLSFWQRFPGLGQNIEEHERTQSSAKTESERKTLPMNDTVEIPSNKAQTECQGVNFSIDVQVFVSQDEQKQTDRNGASQEVSSEDEKTCAAGDEGTDNRTQDQKKTTFYQQHEHKGETNYALQTDDTVEIPSTKAQIETHGVSFSTDVQVFVSQDEQKQTDQNGASQEVSYEDEKTCAAGDEVTDDRTQDQKNTSFNQQHEDKGKINYALQTEEPSNNNGKEQEPPSGLSKIVDACHVHRENAKVIKTWRSWLKDSGLYKASFTYVAVRLTENLTYSYLALYLTDHLRFDKQAIAYVPLTLFVSSLFGTAVAKKLKETFGDKCTFCIAAAEVISSALWFYFLTQETRNMAYAPVVLLGFGLSAQTIMSLAFVSSVIGQDKESSGFVYSVITGLSKIATATYYLFAQILYPTGSEARSNFIRHLLPMSLVALSCSVSVLILLTGTASADQQPPALILVPEATTGSDDTQDPEDSSPQAKDEQV